MFKATLKVRMALNGDRLLIHGSIAQENLGRFLIWMYRTMMHTVVP